MSKITLLLKKYYHILYFLFLSSWILLYQKDGILALGDFVFPTKPWMSLYIRLFSWKEFFLLGRASTTDFVNLIHYLPIFVLSKIGLSITFIQSLFFIFLFFTASYSIYLLLSELLGNFQYKKFIAIIAANFYIFNPYIFTTKLMGYNMSLYTYAFAPLILYLFYKYLNTKNYFKNKYLYLVGICFLLAGPGYTSPAYLTWIIFILFFYVLFLFLFRKFNKIVLYKSLFLVLIFILINSFWLVPSLGSGFFSSTLSKVESLTNLDAVSSNSGQSLVNVVRLLGRRGFVSMWRGLPYYPYYSTYYTPIFIIISFILLIIGLSFCLFKKRQQDKQDNFWRIYFLSIFLLAIFFIGGTVFLLPNFKRWLFENFSIMLLYRKPNEKIGFFLIFSFVGLLAFSLKYITFWLEKRFLKYKKQVIIVFLTIILVLINIYSFPFWTKQIFTSFNHPECKISGINHYPDYYYAFGEYFQKDKKIGRILGLPVNHSPISSGVENYNWGYAGLDPIYSFVNTGYILLNPLMPFFKKFYNGVNSDMTNSIDYKNNLTNFSQLFNVKKVVLRNDICWQLYGSPNPKQDKDYLENNFLKTASFGEVDIYNVPDNNFSPLFYVPKNTIISDQAIESLPQIVSQPDYKIRSVIYFNDELKLKSEKLKAIEQLPNEIEETPILEFRKVNPTKYIVRVHQAKDSFPLVFSESFHKGWKAYVARVKSKELESSKVESEKLKVESEDEILRFAQNDNNYKILEGNEDDQASRAELADYIKNGWVSTLGDGREKEIKHKKYLQSGREKLDHIEKYKIDFISKNFQGTIQNDNLPKGHIWDTWLAGELESEKLESSKVDKIKDIFALNKNVIQLPEENHLMANGYANSWFIDVNQVCKVKSDKAKSFCHKNPDGSYDFEMIVEFWPQRLFYLGLSISGLTLLGCIGYLGYDWRKRRRISLAVKGNETKILNSKH